MSAATLPTTKPKKIVYPDSDGKPMADNTLQYQWILTIQGNLDILFRHDPNVFVAGDLLWYPIKGRPDICAAPDAMVAFGRPKGYRGSYKQWEEGGIAPQAAFEILSPSNSRAEMQGKFNFYETHGVEEYYVLDPEPKRGRPFRFEGWRRDGLGILQSIPVIHHYVSPRLGVRFDTSGPTELVLFGPDGRRFLTVPELGEARERAEEGWAQAELDRAQAERERGQAEQERDAERAARERLAARLRELGIDPETV